MVCSTSKGSEQPAHTRSLIRAFASRLNILEVLSEYSRSVKLLTEHDLESLSLKGSCPGSFESTLVKIPHCWKSHVTAQFILMKSLCKSRLRYNVVPTATVPAVVKPAESVVIVMVTMGVTISVTVPSVGSTLKCDNGENELNWNIH